MFDGLKAAFTGQQWRLVIGGVCVLAALLLLAWFALLRTTYKPLFADLKLSDASSIVAELGRKKIPYRLADGGATVLVPSETVDDARLDVMGGNVPLKGTVGFELFNKADMGLTDFAQKINFQRALQGELERTIMALDGVDTARVHLSMGEERLFRDDQSPPKASVAIRMFKGAVLSESVAQGMRRLVAAAVPKMNPSDVVILDEHGRVVNSGMGSTSGRPASPLLEQKHAIEEYYEGRILQAFSDENVPSSVSVNVSADSFSTAAGSSLSEWTPANRNFPLQITLFSPGPLEPAAASRVHAIIGKIIGVPTMGTDAIRFGGTGAAMDGSMTDATGGGEMERRRVLSPTAVNRQDEHVGGFDWLTVAIPLVVVVLAGFLLVRNLGGPRRLNAKSQAEFVERIRVILEERDNRATS